MKTDEVTQIMVAGKRTGIVGLKDACEAVDKKYRGASDERIRAVLVERLSKINWIAEKVKDQYGLAFLREYKRHVGEPFEQPLAPDSLEVKVLGRGCPRCDRLEMDLMALLTELKLQADLEHVRDPVAISSYGVMGSPGLVINGEVKAVGNIPPASVLKTWLLEAAGK